MCKLRRCEKNTEERREGDKGTKWIHKRKNGAEGSV
jgi:hypothetical protein